MFFPFYDDNPTVRTPFVTMLLIAINVAAWLWLWQQSIFDQTVIVSRYGFVPARISQLRDPRVIKLEIPDELRQQTGHELPAAILLPPDRMEIYATILTSMFLHGGWLHLIGNVWFLWIFGNNIEDRLGHVVFTIFYLAGGLLAMAGQWAQDPASTIPVIGASGAVAAVLGAYAVTFPRSHVIGLLFLIIIFIRVRLPAIVVLGLWFLEQLLEALGTFKLNNIELTESVAWWAHMAGFAAGALLMPILSFFIPPPIPAEEIPPTYPL